MTNWEDREDVLRKPRKRRYMPVDGRSVFILRDLADRRARDLQAYRNRARPYPPVVVD